MSALRYVYEVGAFYIAQLHYGLADLRSDRDFAVRRRSGDNAANLLSALLKRNFRFVPRKATVILYDEERTLDAGRTDFKEIMVRQVVLYRIEIFSDVARDDLAVPVSMPPGISR